MRLAEITEELCRGVGRGETQCHQNAGEWEEALEEWWVTGMQIIPDNYNLLGKISHLRIVIFK